MRDEHRIILSTYYIDPAMDPFRIPDDMFNVGMDTTQLLFLMRWIFGQSEFRYSIEDNRVKIAPKSDKREEYESMTVQSKEVLRKGGIIEIQQSGKRKFETADYLKIGEDLSTERNTPKSQLYFLTILTKWFNCSHLVNERGDVTCYYLLNNQGGKEFIYYLFYMILALLRAYVIEDVEKVDSIICALNKDLVSIKQLYNNVEDILENMAMRDAEIGQGVYEENFFVNQSDLFRDWIRNHKKVMKQSDIWEFIFIDNNSLSANISLKNRAIKLMYHIEKINAFFLKEKSEGVSWAKEMGPEPNCREFYHLDNLIEKLEKGDSNELWDKKAWARRYIQKLLELVREIEYMGSGL